MTTLTRERHALFLKEAIDAQTEAFDKIVNSQALGLLMADMIFVCLLVKVENGEMILKFPNTRGMPRKGEHMKCMTLPTNLRKYKEWSEHLTYGGLLKERGFSTDLHCVWQQIDREAKFSIAGFRGVSVEFAKHVEGSPGAILLIGPKEPPFQYLRNLQAMVLTDKSSAVSSAIDVEVGDMEWEPRPMDNSRDVSQFLEGQMALEDDLLIQGPPGTGKTLMLARLCDRICAKGKSVLVMTLTNRALEEIATKFAEIGSPLLKSGKVRKAGLSVDEKENLPQLGEATDLAIVRNGVMLATFFKASYNITSATKFYYDVVIVDEASQAYLSTIGLAKSLGEKRIFVGDTCQMPPIVEIREERIARLGYEPYLDGLGTFSRSAVVPSFMLTKTFRLPPRAASYTGLFYHGALESCAKMSAQLDLGDDGSLLSRVCHRQGGPSLIITDMAVGDKRPAEAFNIVERLVNELLGSSIYKATEVAVLSYFVDTVKALQKRLGSTRHSQHLLVDTVSRIQGLTTDVVIYLIPDIGLCYTLEKRLFNVATSRARRHTIIIAPPSVMNSGQCRGEVRRFLERLAEERSTRMPFSQG